MCGRFCARLLWSTGKEVDGIMQQPKIRLIFGGALFSVGLGGLAAWMLDQGALPLPLYALLVVTGLALIWAEIRQGLSR